MITITLMMMMMTMVTAACSGNTNCQSCASSGEKCAWCEDNNTCIEDKPFASCGLSCLKKKDAFGKMPIMCSPAICSTYGDCQSCATNGCGWCAATSTCVGASSSGGQTCSSSTSCSSGCLKSKNAFGDMPANCMAKKCSSNDKCSSCTAQTGCGWCTSSQSCVELPSSGSTLSPCPGCTDGMSCLKVETNKCPATNEGVCSNRRDCQSCMDAPNCGWCVTSKSCIETGGMTTFPQSCPAGKCNEDCLKTRTLSGYTMGRCPAPDSNACTNYKSCSTCTKDLACGWFSETQMCVEASRAGYSCFTNGTTFSWGDCNNECQSRGPRKIGDGYSCNQCTSKSATNPDVKCGYCEGYQSTDAGTLGPIDTVCTLTNADNTAPSRPEFQSCRQYRPSTQVDAAPTPDIDPIPAAAAPAPVPSSPILALKSEIDSLTSAANGVSLTDEAAKGTTTSDSNDSCTIGATTPCAKCYNYNSTDCAKASDEGCGWCNGWCVPGRKEGPYRAFDCAGDTWESSQWNYGKLQGTSCTQYRTCDSCVPHFNDNKVAPFQTCGWCSSTASCMSGNRDGPLIGNQCPANTGRDVDLPSWQYNVTVCRARQCSDNKNCSSCSAMDGCGWCDGTCRAGTATGPLSRSVKCQPWIYKNEPMCGDECPKQGSASSCQAKPYCGWCARSHCLWGNEVGPYKQGLLCSPWWYAGSGDDSSSGGGSGTVIGLSVTGAIIGVGILTFVIWRAKPKMLSGMRSSGERSYSANYAAATAASPVVSTREQATKGAYGALVDQPTSG